MSLLATYLEQGLSPDIIDDTDQNDIFLGFFKYNAITAPNYCAIKRLTKETVNGSVVTKIRYPFGHFDFIFSWDERKLYDEWRHRDFPPDEFIPTHLAYLYNLFTLLDPRGIAPAGFHVPTFAEMGVWGNNGADLGEAFRLVTSKYDPLGWSEISGLAPANNVSGFSAVPAGWRQYGLYSGTDFSGLNGLAFFWCNYDGGLYGRYGVISSNNYKELSPTSIPKQMGLSVRFIKDTNVFDPDEIVYDIDGNAYKTCRANASQVWTASNFKAIHFNNGDLIPTVTDATAWSKLMTAAKCAPNNNEAYV